MESSNGTDAPEGLRRICDGQAVGDSESEGQRSAGVVGRIVTEHAMLVQTWSPAEAKHEQEFHYHPLPFFWALLKGDASEILSNGKRRSYRPLVPMFTPAGESHCHCRSDRAPSGLGLILLPTVSSYMEEVWRLGPLEVLEPMAPRVMTRLIAELKRPDTSTPLIIEGLTLELVASAIRQGSGTKDVTAPLWLSRARDMLHDRYRDGLKLSEVAREVGVHAVHLSTEFRRYFGTTPGQYLRQIRLSAAASLLVKSEETIASIGEQLGFYDEAHFSRAFRDAHGMTPSEYRREKS